MATCKNCGEKINFFTDQHGYCPKCYKIAEPAKAQGKTIEQFQMDLSEENLRQQKLNDIAENMLVTTEMFCADPIITERKGVVTAEVVVGMNMFKDLFAGIRNLVGGRSGVVQDALRDIREQVIEEL